MTKPHRGRLLSVAAGLVLWLPMAPGGRGASAEAGGAPAAAERLVPARFSHQRDSQGFNWDINPYGRVEDGSDDCFDGAAVLSINGRDFAPRRPMMTADGSELVLSSEADGIRVTRRVRVDTQRSAACYLEVFQNPGSREARLNVALRTQLGDSCQGVVTSSGATFGNELGKRDCGLVAMCAEPRPSVMFLLAAAGCPCQPAVQVEDNRTFTFTYRLTIKPQGTVSLFHLLAQRRGLAGQRTEALFKPFYDRALVKPQVPRELKHTIVNFPAAGEELAPGTALDAVLRVLESLGLERGEAETLVLDEEARVKGAAAGGEIRVRTRYGAADVPLADVALLCGGAGVGRVPRLYLRDGEVMAGAIEAKGLRLKAEWGMEVPVAPEHLIALATRKGPRDGVPGPEAVALLATHTGDCLAVGGQRPIVLEAATAWGVLRVPLEELVHLGYVREPQPGHRVLLADGTRLTVLLRGETLEVQSLRFGPLRLAMCEIASLTRLGVKAKQATVADEPDEQDAADASGEAGFHLVGENRLAGVFDAAELRLVTASGVVPVHTRKVCRIERRGDEGGKASSGFDIELLGGMKLAGRFEDRVLAIRRHNSVLRVPVQHIESFTTPLPKKREKAPAPKEPEPKEEEPEDEAPPEKAPVEREF